MLKEWVWWQIEASLEHLEEDSAIPFSDLTVYFWMALVVKGCTEIQGRPDCYGLDRGQIYGQSDVNLVPVFAAVMES
jgi:hypothetical protein